MVPANSARRFVFCEGGLSPPFRHCFAMSAATLARSVRSALAGCVSVSFGDLYAINARSSRKQAAHHPHPVQARAASASQPTISAGRQGALGLFRKYAARARRVARTTPAAGSHFRLQTATRCHRPGKALGGGLTPISVAVTTQELHRRAYGAKDRFDLHSSDFCRQRVRMRGRTESLRIIADEALVENSAARGEQLLNGLRAKLSGHPLIVDVRGRGLLIGIEIGPTDTGLVNRLAPGLVSTLSEKVDWAMAGAQTTGARSDLPTQRARVERSAYRTTAHHSARRGSSMRSLRFAAVLNDYRQFAEAPRRRISARVLQQAQFRWRSPS